MVGLSVIEQKSKASQNWNKPAGSGGGLRAVPAA